MAFAVLGFSSCDNDEEETKVSNIELAKAHLNGEVVLSTAAFMNDFNITRLPEGCPAKYKLTWDKDVLVILLNNLKIGSMPFAIYFGCRTMLEDVKAGDKDAPKGDGWMKITGTDGCLAMPGTPVGDYKKGSGATVKGYYNVKSREFEFTMDFNMGKTMPMIAKCGRQVVDKNRLKNYDAELQEFMKKFKEAKEKEKQHGGK